MAVDIGRFIKAPEYNIKIVTYRDIFQIAACEEDRFSGECVGLSAEIILDETEMKRMGIKDDTNVRLSSNWGSVVVKAKASPRNEQTGVGFMVNSPWSNALVSGDTTDCIPDFKNIDAKISVSRDEVTGLDELLGL